MDLSDLFAVRAYNHTPRGVRVQVWSVCPGCFTGPIAGFPPPKTPDGPQCNYGEFANIEEAAETFAEQAMITMMTDDTVPAGANALDEVRAIVCEALRRRRYEGRDRWLVFLFVRAGRLVGYAE